MSRFVDFATAMLMAGAGGDGVVSFCRERYRPRGGPDGGDGGDGGDVICYLDRQRNSLEHITQHQQYRAGDGQHGSRSHRHGTNGTDCLIPIPAGTIMRLHDDHAQTLCEITEQEPRHTVLKGGRGGFGNAKFKTAHNQAPRFAQKGAASTSCRVDFELRLIAHIGLVGIPNAGKSSLLRAISKATPLVANYPFTSLVPTLGVIAPPTASGEPLTAIDIPGIISGAADGRGLGNTFLRHVARVDMIAFVLSLQQIDGLPAEQQLQLLYQELRAYDHTLLAKTALIIANKRDCADSAPAQLRRAIRHAPWAAHAAPIVSAPIVDCSAIYGDGIERLIAILYATYEQAR